MLSGNIKLKDKTISQEQKKNELSRIKPACSKNQLRQSEQLKLLHRHCHEFYNIYNLDISACVPEVSYTEGAGGNYIVHAFGHVFKPVSCKFKGNVRIPYPYPSSAAAAAGIFFDIFHFLEGTDCLDDFPWSIINLIVPAQMAGIMVGDCKVKFLQLEFIQMLGKELGEADDAKLLRDNCS